MINGKHSQTWHSFYMGYCEDYVTIRLFPLACATSQSFLPIFLLFALTLFVANFIFPVGPAIVFIVYFNIVTKLIRNGRRVRARNDLINP